MDSSPTEGELEGLVILDYFHGGACGGHDLPKRPHVLVVREPDGFAGFLEVLHEVNVAVGGWGLWWWRWGNSHCAMLGMERGVNGRRYSGVWLEF